jgi:L-threonylcarbamoyladenylate synthase
MPQHFPRIFQPTPANLRRLAAILKGGGIVGVPSETVYGLAANALNPEACAGIFRAKGRPSTDPLIVHLASARDLDKVAIVNEAALKLACACWPGPLTLVLPKKHCVPDLVTAGKSTVAVRVPAHPLFRRLIRMAGTPLAAPSANPFGYISPTSASHVRDGLKDTELRAILDGGDCRIGVESTILELTRPERPRLLRPGGLPASKIEKILGYNVHQPRKPPRVRDGVAAIAPGMLSRHYSPQTPLCLHDSLSEKWIQMLAKNEAVLLLKRPGLRLINDPRVHWLSQRGQLTHIARALFTKLRELDIIGWAKIHVECPIGNESLAPAIRDRLSRAAAKNTE